MSQQFLEESLLQKNKYRSTFNPQSKKLPQQKQRLSYYQSKYSRLFPTSLILFNNTEKQVYGQDNQSYSSFHSIILGQDDDQFSKSSVQLINQSTYHEGQQKRKSGIQIIKKDKNKHKYISEIKELDIKQVKFKPMFQQKKPIKDQYSFNKTIFNLPNKIMNALYFTNLVINILMRVTFLVTFIFMIVENKRESLIGYILSMELFTIVLYALALVKLLHTKSQPVSVYLQKWFYEKPYYEIQMDRILRKHFTPRKIFNNFIKYLNPISEFKKNMKITFLRQQIYKRIEIVLCIIPFIIIFIIFPHQFQFDNWNSSLFISTVIVIQVCTITIHYCIVYVFT